MKRFVAMLLTLVLWSSIAGAEPVSIDISNLSLEKLISLDIEIQERIMELTDQKELSVPQGNYTIGKHIPSGEYTIVCNREYGFTLLVIYETKGGSKRGLYTVTKENPIGLMELTDGNYIEISGSNLEFSPFTGIASR